ncbi:hypothetical protein [Methanosphaerula palustris]|uniref:Uncharacterized protein n=1 Tax=Methanosphaerula palustris (strain ATCC BAA-1556 / DSM 19958 / E1-9c) TaxID=521011 RepID=B8GJB5_METPE|nr:hypothetical protein [Methanosphaerula palustris]ACL16956.1 hypothetical protein Mpal_1644 [Methanosphaerula palustris E1-9c]
MSSHLPSDRIRWGICLAVLALLLTFALVAVASATPPPPEYRAQLAAPNLEYLNTSDSGLFIKVDSYSSEQGLAKRPSSLPNVSDNYYYSTFTSPKTGEQYLDAVWYFNTWDGFTKGKDELNRYLQQHGTVTPVVLNLSPELAGSSISDIRDLSGTEQWRTINATRYEGEGTSGDFLTFATNYFPGENYYIAYYGITGSTNVSEDATHHQHLLAMTSIPRFVMSHWYEFDPATPMTIPDYSSSPAYWANQLVVISPLLLLVIGFTYIPVIALAYITARIALWMEARITPRIRVILPLIVVGCLIGLLAVRALYIEEVWVGLTDILVTAVLVPMGVLTAWPVFEGHLTIVKPRSAVYFCVAGTLFAIILATASFFLIKVFVIDGQPVSFFVSDSVVVRSIILYLMSVVIAIVLYSVTLLWDRLQRRRQNKHPAEGEDL